MNVHGMSGFRSRQQHREAFVSSETVKVTLFMAAVVGFVAGVLFTYIGPLDRAVERMLGF